MKKPQKGEYWHVNNNSLTGKESNSIVKVLEDKELSPSNWRENRFLCKVKDGDDFPIKGSFFVEKLLDSE